MTIKDILHKKLSSDHPSLNDNMSKHQKTNKILKQVHSSVLDLLNWHRPKENNDVKTVQFDCPSSSAEKTSSDIKSSDMSRALSKKSVTFASVFDLKDEKNNIVRISKFYFITTSFIQWGKSVTSVLRSTSEVPMKYR